MVGLSFWAKKVERLVLLPVGPFASKKGHQIFFRLQPVPTGLIGAAGSTG
jgi:hypothetical protein